MFYVAERLKVVGVVYKLIDFTTKEEQSASRDELKERILSGETIIGVSIINNNIIVKTKGGLGEISLEDYAILTNRQYLLDEFDYEANNTTPDKVPYARNEEGYWICSKGHKYPAFFNSRTSAKTGCPYCHNKKILKGFNDFETWCKNNNRQDLLDEWDNDRNKVTVSEVMPFTNKDFYWVCTKGHSFKATINNRTGVNHSGCSKCHNQTSFPEQAVLYYLKNSDLPSVESRFRYQVEDKKYEIDIYIPSLKVGIEYDGTKWHGKSRIETDERKNKVLNEIGIKLVRMREEGCPIIEAYNSEVVIVKDLDTSIRELFKYLSKNYGVCFNGFISTKQDRGIILSEYKSDEQDKSFIYTHPSIAMEWAYDLNGQLKPDMFKVGSTERVWWRCKDCGNEYVARIYKRCINLTGCSKCGNFFKTELFKDKYSDILAFLPKDLNPNIATLVSSTSEVFSVRCPSCEFTESVKYLSDRIRVDRGLTCRQCGFHIDCKKFSMKDEVMGETANLAAGFAEFLKNKSNK